MRILLLHNIINPHMNPVFESLASMPDVQLRVVYFAETEADRDWRENANTSLESQILTGRRLDINLAWDTLSFHFNPGLGRRISEWDWDVMINSGWSSPSNWQAFLACRRLGRRQVLWAGSTEHERSWQRTLTLPAVRYFVRRHHAWASYGTASGRYLAQLGAKPERIVHAYHSIDNTKFLSQLQHSQESAAELRRKLNLEGKRVILFVGRLLRRKGGDTLIRALAQATSRLTNAVLLIVGQGPCLSQWKALAEGQPGFTAKFVGHVPLDKLPAYYNLADVFVLPSLEEVWGLVLNEAALTGIPLIATDKCGAALDLIQNGVNGFVVRAGDINQLAQALTNVFTDERRRIQMCEASRLTVKKCTPEALAQSLLKAASIACNTQST